MMKAEILALGWLRLSRSKPLTAVHQAANLKLILNVQFHHQRFSFSCIGLICFTAFFENQRIEWRASSLPSSSS